MCMPPNQSAMGSLMNARGGSAAAMPFFAQLGAATNESFVRSVYDKEGTEGFKRTFGPYDGGPKNPFGGAAYRTLAKQQGREFDPKDLFGERAAQESRFSALEQQIKDLKRAGVATAATTAKAVAANPKKFTTISQAKDYRTKPSPTSMNTTYGLKSFGSLNGPSGLNTPN